MVRRITKFIDQGLQVVLQVPGVRLQHPLNCVALYQEAPWQLAMNIGIEHGLEIVLPTQVSWQQCTV